MRLAEPARGKTRKGLWTRQDHRRKKKKNGSELETKQKAPASIDCIQQGLTRTKSKQAANPRPQQWSHFLLDLFAKPREQAAAF